MLDDLLSKKTPLIVVECMSKPFEGGKNILKVDLAVDAKCAQNWYAAKQIVVYAAKKIVVLAQTDVNWFQTLVARCIFPLKKDIELKYSSFSLLLQ